MADISTNRNSDDMTVWVPNEAFEFLQKLWKPEYQWAPVPVDRSLATAPESIAFIETGGSGTTTPIAPPPQSQTPKVLPRIPRAPLPPLETSPERQSGMIRRNSGSVGLGTAVTTIMSSPEEITSPQTPSTATGPENLESAIDVKLRDTPPPNLYSGGWKDRNNRLAAQAMENPATEPWKLEDGREGHKKVGTRPVFRQTLDGKRALGDSDKFLPRMTTRTKWHTSRKGFAVRLELDLNVEVQLKAIVSGDITLSAEALFVSIERYSSPST